MTTQTKGGFDYDDMVHGTRRLLVTQTVEYFGGTYRKSVIIKEAREKANKTGLPVTVYGDNTNRSFVIFPEKKGGR